MDVADVADHTAIAEYSGQALCRASMVDWCGGTVHVITDTICTPLARSCETDGGLQARSPGVRL